MGFRRSERAWKCALSRSLAPQNAVIKQPGIVRACVLRAFVCLVRVPFTRANPAGLAQARLAIRPLFRSASKSPTPHSLTPSSLTPRPIPPPLPSFILSEFAIKISRPPPPLSRVVSDPRRVFVAQKTMLALYRQRATEGEGNSVIHGIFYFVKIGCTERAFLWRQERRAISLHPPAPALLHPPRAFVFLFVFSSPRPNGRETFTATSGSYS